MISGWDQYPGYADMGGYAVFPTQEYVQSLSDEGLKQFLLQWREWYQADQESFEGLLAWWGIEERVSRILPEYQVEVSWSTSMSRAKRHIKRVIQAIGIQIGGAADQLVAGTIESVPGSPHMEPQLVWRMARAFWTEIVHRAIELGWTEHFHVKGIREFPYVEVLMFVQHIRKAFLCHTKLDFMDPVQSAIIKSWFGALSPRSTQRAERPTAWMTPGETRFFGDYLNQEAALKEKTRRFWQVVEHGGDSIGDKKPAPWTELEDLYDNPSD